ncbi:MAG: zinc metallopeptidase [Bacteroidales bacterium]|nr:zinc metallopeptidase [Bacteroidales bacterium]MBN2820341.1 zinc metallopeptidase [Bacteroidales bacterium]
MIDIGYILIFAVFAIFSMIIGQTLKSKFRKYSKIPINYGMSGKDVAVKMLQDNGIYDVDVVPTKGQLSDHYNPVTKTVALSHDVYYGQNVSAAAVAAHECGHAIQHANAYAPLKLRTALVPLQNISAQILNTIFTLMFFGIFFFNASSGFGTIALTIIVAAYAVFTLVAFVTLPVEINASQRALAWLSNSGITNYNNHSQAKDALKWAAYTYVVAALSSLAMLLYFLLRLVGSRD